MPWCGERLTAPDTEADHRLYDNYAKERTYHEDEKVHTRFPEDEDR